MELDGRTALVTGASSGIGAATAAVLAAAGCRLVVTGRDEHRLTEVAERTGARSVVADLTDPAQLRLVAEAAREADLLVHSAGVGWAGDLAAMPPDSVAGLVALNLTAPVLLTQAALPGMSRRRRGHVVFVSSIAVVGVRDEEVYAATKGGLRAFAASIRFQAAARGVGVTTVFPGAVRTPFFGNRGRPYTRGFPRMVAPAAVAEAVLDGVRRERGEVFVPRWLSAAARLHGAFPGAFHRAARRAG
ncbi:hypothetical protein A8924_4710 [Saccharopolyspora erythraea NRRL 2338]|uniref:Oxidoreductase, short-chain dehydrogenase/reductase family n=2 Tax=Saccharopolyspora erythraea TaxID=1836 RepID=A4FHR7_SACEN|nr:SDR family oxidoreductase [Saccharopolyspora erythraea]EQD83103.1 short-chain dehydrogenase [Saccharopolyspora erythraea D]PFG97279.1 hypothetical protein A8924_4710 [Saccharopolyspora erythraea NRRL 2338]QRK87474.1 SDR family oxidoreductase [Saccharopolyspora erythraea]CAM03592.1 oxidoreductase, short-chain dehydrogenase/reductase family [Saccharopolyspora erythraea NRRL 2338]